MSHQPKIPKVRLGVLGRHTWHVPQTPADADSMIDAGLVVVRDNRHVRADQHVREQVRLAGAERAVVATPPARSMAWTSFSPSTT